MNWLFWVGWWMNLVGMLGTQRFPRFYGTPDRECEQLQNRRNSQFSRLSVLGIALAVVGCFT